MLLVDLESSLFETKIVMRLTAWQVNEITPKLWQDPEGDGRQLLNVLYIAVKCAPSGSERMEMFEIYKKFDVATACCMGLGAVINAGREKMTAYFDICMMFLTLWVQECRTLRAEILRGGMLFLRIIPSGLRASHHSDASALLFMQLLHVYLHKHVRFFEGFGDRLARVTIDALFDVGSRWKLSTELRTFFFTILRDCPFRQHRDMLSIKWLVHRGRELLFFSKATGELLRYPNFQVKFARRVRRKKVQVFDGLRVDVKEEANCLLKLNLYLVSLRDCERRFRALEDCVAARFQHEEDRSSTEERPRKRARRRSRIVSDYNKNRGFTVACLVANFQHEHV